MDGRVKIPFGSNGTVSAGGFGSLAVSGVLDIGYAIVCPSWLYQSVNDDDWPYFDSRNRRHPAVSHPQVFCVRMDAKKPGAHHCGPGTE
jgi:hypothetical protein